jgi:transcriptional regulator with XRE-family HTH domain
MPGIGKRIRKKREELGITQEDLAQKLGYKNKSTIAKIETGTNDIVQSKVVKFAEVLNTTVAYLMGWEDEGEPTSPLPSNEEVKISNLLRKLNDAGKREATKRVEELTYIPAYAIAPSASSSSDNSEPLLTAAHARTDVEVTEEGIQNDLALMDDDDNWT